MKSRSRKLAEHSINSALSAIEIYNKPDFRDREQIFCVLMTVAWEALLKARVVQQNSNRLNSLYIKDSKGHFKRNRNNLPFTIDVYEALRRCAIDPTAAANISHIVEIRDVVVHLTGESPTLPYLVFTLGTASLRNYVKLLNTWFGISLSQYHFYILPLAFATPFKTLKMADFQHEPEEVRSVIQSVARDQAHLEESKDFLFICEIETTLVSAKKITQSTDLVATLDSENPDAIIVQRPVSSLDQYPLSAGELVDAVRLVASQATKNKIWAAIKLLKMKDDARYSKYSYRTKKDIALGPKKASGSIYNQNAVELLVEHFQMQQAAVAAD